MISITFVPVGPVLNNDFLDSRKTLLLLLRKASSESIMSFFEFMVLPLTIAPEAFVGPSLPSVPEASKTIFDIPQISLENAKASS